LNFNDIELLAPAGDWDAMIAAVESGADAVYLGMKTLNARRGAGNFDEETLTRAVEYCHERGKRVYVTVNTMVKQAELGLLSEVAGSLARAGADAAIVQDLGAARALHEMLPSLHLHASTQMAVHNRQGLEVLKACGFQRGVLAREMSFEEIAECAKTGLELEVFCHGALCVSASGQCLFSSIVGGRSGNRGMCAQPCRLRYTLEGAKGANEGHLLSPRDLMTVEILEDMKKSSVKSLKIEGRLKRPEYVHIVTGIYRRALDGDEITGTDIEALKQIFNRGGFTKGYAPGINDGEFISRVRPSHWGVKVGESTDGRKIRLLSDVLSADAVTVRDARGEDVPLNIAGYAGETVKNPTGVRGDVMRLVSRRQTDQVHESLNTMARSVRLTGRLSLHVGKPACVSVSDGNTEVSVCGQEVERASRAGADAEKIRAQFSKTGGTPYFMDEIKVDADENAFVPASMINQLRRDALEKLKAERLSYFRRTDKTALPYKSSPLPRENGKTRLVACASDIEKLELLRKAGADEAAFLPKDIRRGALDDCIKNVKDFFLVLPPVTPRKSLEYLSEWALRNEDRISGVYISNIGQTAVKWPGETRYDYPMNIANGEALRFLNAENRVFTPSVELTAREAEMIGGRQELVVYGRICLMHLRHCPLNAALGGGKHIACHRCDMKNPKETLEKCALRDRMNVEFPLLRSATEEGCVTEVMNSVPLCLLKHASKLPKADGFRLIFTTETEDEIKNIVRAFRDLIDTGRAAQIPDGNFTTGHYFRPAE